MSTDPKKRLVSVNWWLPELPYWLKVTFYRPQRSCGQGNIFTPVCHSVHRGGGSASMHAGIPTPWDQTPPSPQSRCPPSRHPPGADTPPGPDPPRPGTTWSRHPLDQTPPLGAETPPPRADTPWKQTPAYSLRATSTHPTGMHSCWPKILQLWSALDENKILGE